MKSQKNLPATPPTAPQGVSVPSRARFAALGILSSKVFGLVRESALAHYFGVGAVMDVYRAAMRAPNALQNLLGEQTLSAAFIPQYSRMLEQDEERAGRFAGAVFGLLLATVCVLVTLGVIFAPYIVSVLAAGFLGDAEKVATGEITIDRFALLVKAVRIIFPMTGVMVLAAWALGILNSHRRFLLPYMSPAVWNAAILTALGIATVSSGHLLAPDSASLGTRVDWLYFVCWGALVGGALQFLVQVPLVLKLSRGLRLSMSTKAEGMREMLSTLGPALAGRGVVQLSIYVDTLLATFLAAGGVAAISYAVVLINLPLGVFAMSVAAAELPELARTKKEDIAQRLAPRVQRAIRQSMFVISPSVFGYLGFGFLVVGLLFRHGRFELADNYIVYFVLCAYALGMLASTVSRLLQNTFFALQDTRTPAKIAMARLAGSAGAGIPLMLWFDRFAVGDLVPDVAGASQLFLGAVGLGLASALGAWCELLLLAWALKRRVPSLLLPWRPVLAHLGLALTMLAPALAVWYWIANWHHLLQAAIVLPTYIVAYLGFASWRRRPEIEMWLGSGRLGRWLSRR